MRKLAITISGAVSLGSYEAGVLYEVFSALKSHNIACDAAGAADEKILVDVMTGASAGGMSATIAVQKLLFDADQLDDPAGNAFYRPWVKDISLQKLLGDNPDTRAGKSILDSGVVHTIAQQYLLGRFPETGDAPAPNRHPAADATMHLGLAMSNLNGMNYGIKTSGGEFNYTKFADQVLCTVTGDQACNNAAFWQPIVQATLACGAFPFAFADREVLRTRMDYADGTNLDLRDVPPDPLRFAYVDGGLFQNEPLGLAKNIVDDIEKGGNTSDDRIYMYIAPSLREREADFKFSAGKANYCTNLLRLIIVIFNQARFQDWITTEKVNTKVEKSNEPARQLQQSLLDGSVQVDEVKKASAAVTPLMAKTGNKPRGSALGRARRKGLQKEYQQLASAPHIGVSGADAWLNAVHPASAAPASSPYDFMPVVSIIADPTELAGGALEAFGGFFDEKYRQHDYDLGRSKAQAVLMDGSTHLGVLRSYDPKPVTRYTTLDNRQPGDLDRKLRTQLRDHLRSGIKMMLQQSGKVNFIGRLFADWFVIVPMLNTWLDL